MKVIDELKKLNKYKCVSIPRNRDLYERVGGRIPPIGSGGFTAELGKNKLDIMASDVEYVEAQMLKDNQMPADTPLPKK